MKDLTRLQNWFLLVFACAITFSCAKSVRVASQGKGAKEVVAKVAVLPFASFADSPGAGKTVAALLASSWKNSHPAFELLGPDLCERELAAKYIRMPERVDRTAAAELGSVLGVDAVVIGSVLEYGQVRRPRRRMVVLEPVAGLHLQLVRVKDGVILWTGGLARNSGATVLPAKETSEDVSAKIISALLPELNSKLKGGTP